MLLKLKIYINSYVVMEHIKFEFVHISSHCARFIDSDGDKDLIWMIVTNKYSSCVASHYPKII